MVVEKVLLTSLDLQKRTLEDHVECFECFWKLHLAKLESEANSIHGEACQFPSPLRLLLAAGAALSLSESFHNL